MAPSMALEAVEEDAVVVEEEVSADLDALVAQAKARAVVVVGEGTVAL